MVAELMFGDKYVKADDNLLKTPDYTLMVLENLSKRILSRC
jgi:hypothetical protein